MSAANNGQAGEMMQGDGDTPPTETSSLTAAGIAKELCSAVYWSGRDPDAFMRTSSHFWMVPSDRDAGATYALDRERQSATVTVQGVSRTAIRVGDHGCVLLPVAREAPGFAALPARSALPAAASQPWPTGDCDAEGDESEEIDRARIAAAVDRAFTPTAHTAAYIVLHKGRIVAERYAADISPETPLPGWSMTKTLQAALVGLLAAEGKLKLTDPIPIAEWQDDARKDIRWLDLLRMSSGLDCTGELQWDEDKWRADYPGLLYLLVGQKDSYKYSLSRPAEFAPQFTGRYRNCDPHVVGAAVSRILAENGESYLTWPRRALFDRIGMRSMTIEPDYSGNPLTSAYSYATARDWARLGLLLVQDGVWEGKRLLDRDFMDLLQAPAPAWLNGEYPAEGDRPQSLYAGQVWRTGYFAHSQLPSDTYSLEGIEGQEMIIIPSRDLVILRLGHGAGGEPKFWPEVPYYRPVMDAAAAIVEAVDTQEARSGDAIRELVEAYFIALEQGDLDAMRAVSTSDFFLFDLGMVLTNEQLAQAIWSSKAKGMDLRWLPSSFRIAVKGELATFSYWNQSWHGSPDTLLKDNVIYLESAAAVREDGRWKLAFLHSTEYRPHQDFG